MKHYISLTFSIIAFLLLAFNTVNGQKIEQVQLGRPTSIRGLSVVNDSVAWLSGSRGTIAITKNGGKTWIWQQVKGFEKADFRDIEAFSATEAVIMSSGTPALILKTIDGGTNWKVNYNVPDTTYFLDAMDFDTPTHGFIVGDPIKNKLLLLETHDGGDTWTPFKFQPDALTGEACFAASGTCLRIYRHLPVIVTGGTAARMITMEITPAAFVSALPVLLRHGKASQGAFSIAYNNDNAVIVGGDYADNKKTDSTAIYFTGAEGMHLSTRQPVGFQSCVEHIAGNMFLATGTPGSNITSDGGKTWTQIDTASYNVCRKAKSGKLVLLAGDGGRIGIFKL